jgi:hypothetical protein
MCCLNHGTKWERCPAALLNSLLGELWNHHVYIGGKEKCLSLPGTEL